MFRNRRQRLALSRRGAVAVEFAVVAPILVALVMGVTETTRLFEVQNQLALAAREGARLASMDRSGLVADGQSNQKVEADVKDFLTASGLPGDKANVSIVEAGSANKTFDLDDPANDLKLFEIRVEMPYNAFSRLALPAGDNFNLTSSVVFRNARAAIVQ
jgi:Flp pilus assembly protein TadG